MSILPRPAIFSNISVVSLLASNLVPIIGVLFWGWNLKPILFVFWLENFVIGFWTLLKMLKIGGIGGIPLVIFFMFHYGFFTFLHLVFLLALFLSDFHMGIIPFNSKLNFILSWNIIFAFTAIFISHGISYVSNFIGRKEYLNHTLTEQMIAPYKRVFVMHITIVFGAFLVLLFQDQKIVLLLFVLVKILIDCKTHFAEHAFTPRLISLENKTIPL